MKIYLVRHAESVGNKAGLHQTAEMTLSDSGLKQAKVVANRLKNRKIDLIYSSTHERARQTAGIIARTLKIPIEYWDRLIEIRNPSQIHNRPINNPEVNKIKELIKKNFAKGDWKYSDEETFFELNERVGKVLKHLLLKHKNQNLICVSHASIIKAIICKMVFGEKLTPEIFSAIRYGFWSSNTGISVCEYDKKRGWGVMSWNDASHL